MRTAIVTIAHGRHEHFLRQRAAVARTARAVDEHVLVAIDDPALESLGRETPSTPTVDGEPSPPPLRIVSTHARELGLPLASARNLGARTAIEAGAELLVFLDVDCLPAPGLVSGYATAASTPATRGALLCGPVTYLPPSGAEGYDLASLETYDSPHPARPAPRPGETLLGGRHELFWSLSFAVDTAIWTRIGGFCEDYVGYGAEDTDFGQRAREAGVGLAWVGDARAYHQHHPTADPPRQHLDAILRNGAVFADTWGWWPMQGWLDDFERAGLVQRDAEGGYRRTDAA